MRTRQGRLISGLVFVAFLYVLARRIPLPGIDLGALLRQPGALGRDWGRFSILVLGLMPYVTVLAYREGLFLCTGVTAGCPPARWIGLASAAVPVLTLLLALFQAYGVAGVLQHYPPLTGDADFSIPLAMTAMVGTTALFVLLAQRIRLPGLRDGGLWFILALGIADGLPGVAVRIAELTHRFVIPWPQLALDLGYPLASCAAAVFMGFLLRRVQETAVGGAGPVSRDALLWPMVIASEVTPWLATPVLAVLLPKLGDGAMTVQQVAAIVRSGVAAALIVACVFGYVWRYRAAGMATPRISAIAAVMAAFQVAVAVPGWLVPGLFGLALPLNGGSVVVLTVTLISIAEALGWTAAAGTTERPSPTSR
jgi:hypothetical protein